MREGKNNFLTTFPDPDEILQQLNHASVPDFREVNAHMHTPYSFSAFHQMEELFDMANKEDIAVLGINDFYVADGYEMFHDLCIKNKNFPLFNIEFIGLMKEEQDTGIRINDPNNPGRVYFTGKGLDYPFHLNWWYRRQLNGVIKESQAQVIQMISKANRLINELNPAMHLTYADIKKRFAHELVRERHIAKAIRVMADENYPGEKERSEFYKSLYGGKESKANFSNAAALENEIRSVILKTGGPAYVEENKRSFLELNKIIRIIIKAGGIPCYPVLLDDLQGRFTEFEGDRELLHQFLTEHGISCIELIPVRNDFLILKEFVQFFHRKGFIILFGTEHNTPEMIPLTVTTRGGIPLDEELKRISWEGACIVAAHQYLRSRREQGYFYPCGTPRLQDKEKLAAIGKAVIEYFLKHKLNET